MMLPGVSLDNGPPRGQAACQTRPQKPREWKCDVCDQAFRKKEHLSRHALSHTKEKPFKCNVCSKMYGRQDSLIRHARKHATRAASQGHERPDSNASPTNIQNEGNDVSISIGAGHQHHPHLSNGMEPGYYPMNEPLQTAFNDMGLAEDPFGMAAGASYAMQDPFANASPFNFGAGADDSFWMLPVDFYQTLQGFSGPNALPTDPGMSATPFYATQTPRAPQPQVRPPPQDPCEALRLRTSIQERWHTKLTPDSPTISHSIGSQDQDKVDETYRAGLSNQLQPSPQDIVLPSPDFFNMCIKLYFSKFHPVFPIVHCPSFRPSSENSLLLLSICSIGALFIGSDRAKACGRAIFRKLNKAILASWESYLAQGSRETLAISQAVTLGQTFGMLSGNPSDLFLAESFHGTIIAWSRQTGIFRSKSALDSVDFDASDPETSWRSWIHAEESARVLLALHVHDAMFSAIFHHEPILRHEPERLPRCSPEPLFSASTASAWQTRLASSNTTTARNTPHPDNADPVLSPSNSVMLPSPMNSYASLIGINASVNEARASSLTDETARNLRRSLMLWADLWFVNAKGIEDAFYLTILWNEAFMSLYADFDLLERVVGREGTSASADDVDAVWKWTATTDGKRCAAHAVLVLKNLEMMSASAEPSIHVPLALFHAGIVVYSHIHFGGPETPPVAFDIPELPVRCSTLVRILGSRTIQHGYKLGAPTLSDLNDLLRRQGHWDISRKFASILELLLEDIADPGGRRTQPTDQAV